MDTRPVPHTINPLMPRSTSIFLDALRLLAALIVFASHASYILFHASIWIPGHLAVMIFFVLSGYVIAYTTFRRPCTPKEYAIARFSRLYSVVIPALILTQLLFLIGKAIHPGFYGAEGLGRYFLTFFFLQSIWCTDYSPLTNGLFWSLGYEFWYYVMFAVVVFGRGVKWKVMGSLLCCLFVGPSILLLLPVWITGVVAYLYRDKFPTVSPRMAGIAFVLAPIAGLFLRSIIPAYPQPAGNHPLLFAAAFVTDWINGICLGAMIWSFNRAFAKITVFPAVENATRWGAAHTFSLYLFHFPLLLFVASFGIHELHGWWRSTLAITGVLGVVLFLSHFTEAQRKPMQKIVSRYFGGLSRVRAT